MTHHGASTAEPVSRARDWLSRHGDALYRFALARVGKRENAEELVQETYLAALRGRERFAGRCDERTWLTGILKHKIVDFFRASKHAERATDDEGAEDYVSEPFDGNGRWRARPGAWGGRPDQILENREFHAALARCLSTLPPSTSAAFVLREVERLDGEAICKLLGLSPTNYWTMLHRARMQLRSCLEDTWFLRDKAVPESTCSTASK